MSGMSTEDCADHDADTANGGRAGFGVMTLRTVVAYLLTWTTLAPIYGKLSDLYGRGRLIAKIHPFYVQKAVLGFLGVIQHGDRLARLKRHPATPVDLTFRRNVLPPLAIYKLVA